MANIIARLQDQVPDVLRHINEKKAEHVAFCKTKTSLEDLKAGLDEASPVRGFGDALRTSHDAGRFALIAELKKASPSKGLIRADFDPERLAQNYEEGGASCLSVLTDAPFFQGEDRYLQMARNAVDLPVLRKDFMIDPYQVYEARVLGADCILLIMAALEDSLAAELEALAHSLGMDALIEVHNEPELERALTHLTSPLIGVNNRDLVRLETDLETSRALAKQIPAGRFMISESGLNSRDQLEDLAGHGAKGFLIGESLMRHDDVTGATQDILGIQP